MKSFIFYLFFTKLVTRTCSYVLCIKNNKLLSFYYLDAILFLKKINFLKNKN